MRYLEWQVPLRATIAPAAAAASMSLRWFRLGRGLRVEKGDSPMVLPAAYSASLADATADFSGVQSSESAGTLAHRQFLQNAAEPTLDRIRLDRATAPDKLKPMLSYIEMHLFDDGLSVNRMKRECGIRDNSVAIHFHACVGQPPHTYITARRMEVARRLLADSDLPVWRVSAMLGFSSIQVFSRAFYRATHERPSVYRRKHRPPVPRDSPNANLGGGFQAEGSTLESSTANGQILQLALAGQLCDAEAARLIRQLLELYPPRRVR